MSDANIHQFKESHKKLVKEAMTDDTQTPEKELRTPQEIVQYIEVQSSITLRKTLIDGDPKYHSEMIADSAKLIDQYATARVVEELEKLEPMTHEGRGTIAWEMDELSTYVNNRITHLKAKETGGTEG